MGKKTRWWIIQSKSGKVLKEDNGKFRFFATPDEALTYIGVSCGDSPNLNIKEWKPSPTKKE